MAADQVRWRTGPVVDGRLLRSLPVGPVEAVSAIEHDGRLVVATASPGHYDGDCLRAARHNCYESFLHVRDFVTGSEIARIAGAGGDWVSLIRLDGRLCAVVAVHDEPARCWDIAAAEARVVAMPSSPVVSMAVGQRHGQPVVAIDTGDAVTVWGLATGDLVEQFGAAKGWPCGVWDIDGAWVRASSSWDHTVVVRRLVDGSVMHEIRTVTMVMRRPARPKPPRGWAHRLPSALALAGGYLAVAHPAIVDLYVLTTGEKSTALTTHTAGARLATLMIGGDPHLVTASPYGEVRLWDLATPGPVEGDRHADRICTVEFVAASPEPSDGEACDMVVTGDAAGSVRRWRLADGSPIGEPLDDRLGPVQALAVTPAGGGPVLVTAGGNVNDGKDSGLRFWDPVAGSQMRTPLGTIHGGESSALALSEVDGRVAVLSAGNDRYLTAWDARTGEKIRRVATGRYPVTGLAVGWIRGRPVAVISRHLTDPIQFVDIAEWSSLGWLVAPHGLFDIVHGLVTADDGAATMVTTGGGMLRLWTPEGDTWQSRECPYEPGAVTAVAVTSRPRALVAVGYADRTLSLIDPITSTPLTSHLHLPDLCIALAFGPAGELAASHGIDLTVFDVEAMLTHTRPEP